MLSAIVNGHKQSQINDLLPWNYIQIGGFGTPLMAHDAGQGFAKAVAMDCIV